MTHTETGLPIVSKETIHEFGKRESTIAMQKVQTLLSGVSIDPAAALVDTEELLGISVERLENEQPGLVGYIRSIVMGLPAVAAATDGDVKAIMQFVEVGMIRMYRLLEVAEENAKKG